MKQEKLQNQRAQGFLQLCCRRQPQEMISKINHRAIFGWSRNQSDDVFEFLRFDGYDLPQGIG